MPGAGSRGAATVSIVCHIHRKISKSSLLNEINDLADVSLCPLRGPLGLSPSPQGSSSPAYSSSDDHRGPFLLGLTKVIFTQLLDDEDEEALIAILGEASLMKLPTNASVFRVRTSGGPRHADDRVLWRLPLNVSSFSDRILDIGLAFVEARLDIKVYGQCTTPRISASFPVPP